ncbi:MAG TPA: alpha/beta fold hydrolase [Nocardioidaceae bacterium]|nr:alpha/beta fold hydrolase [Nocardioidaceae bacterium]
MLSSLSPARRRFVWGVVAIVTAAGVAAGVVLGVRAQSDVQAVDQDVPGPVLLVPGYGGDGGSLQPLARRMREQGRDVTVIDSAGDGTIDLRVQAQTLGEAAEQAMSRTGAGSVDVVGYSAGGVVARIWVDQYGGADVARRVLTLGSPHHGTAVADLAAGVVRCTTACRQLAPDSDLLRRLNAGDETPEGPEFVSIWSTADEVVTPPDSARLDGALNVTVQSVCESSRLSHADLPSNPTVATIVADELASAAPATPSARECRAASS